MLGTKNNKRICGNCKHLEPYTAGGDFIHMPGGREDFRCSFVGVKDEYKTGKVEPYEYGSWRICNILIQSCNRFEFGEESKKKQVEKEETEAIVLLVKNAVLKDSTIKS